MGSVYSRGLHANGVCTSMRAQSVKFFLSDYTADTLNYSRVGHRHTKDAADKETILIVPE